jgi:very-short-patch-repair endonuclease
MPRTARIPSELTKRPFALEEAREAGVTLDALRSPVWRRLGAELYAWSGLKEDPLLLLRVWARLLPRDVVFAGATAAWLHGLDLPPTKPVEVVAPPSSSLRTREGLRVRRCEVPAAELVSRQGLRATALPRTLASLCLQGPAVEALVAIDMALRKHRTDAATLVSYGQKGGPGGKRLRSLAAIAAPAESPMETRLRWLLIQARLPRPEVQTELGDAARFAGRVDLYYPQARLVLEFDGGNHRERLVEDDRRQNLLINAGFRLLRFTAADIYQRADVVVAQVRAALLFKHNPRFQD